ncbi:MAG: biotin/lipoyl-binding protein [Desulfovibrio sp.]|jgi:membrane fusion protein (multidrug efflux system)|nr:biotin/lipoyl-binding protein [Desulfovibrio sp.]
MAEQLRLEMVAAAPRRFLARFPRKGLAAALAAIFALAALSCWWWFQGRVSSVAATLDEQMYPVAPEFSARLEELAVRVGDRVKANQMVGRMDAKAYERRLREAGKDAAALRPTLMEETAERLAKAQAAEKAITERLAQARNEEETRRRSREERVLEHVRAQLALRTLDSQGGEKKVGKTRYEDARQAEAQTRTAMETAGEEFEQASRQRAAVDQELRRLREEGLKIAEGGQSASPPLEADGTLYAPVSGTVTQTPFKPGQMVKRGQPVALIRPEAENGGIVAWFPVENKNSLNAGQACDVRLEGEEEPLRGEVVEIMTPGALPPDVHPFGADGNMNRDIFDNVHIFVPVRIRLKDRLRPDTRRGGPTSCVVRTRGFF